jgi:hypothetical protein
VLNLNQRVIFISNNNINRIKKDKLYIKNSPIIFLILYFLKNKKLKKTFYSKQNEKRSGELQLLYRRNGIRYAIKKMIFYFE